MALIRRSGKSAQQTRDPLRSGQHFGPPISAGPSRVQKKQDTPLPSFQPPSAINQLRKDIMKLYDDVSEQERQFQATLDKFNEPCPFKDYKVQGSRDYHNDVVKRKDALLRSQSLETRWLTEQISPALVNVREQVSNLITSQGQSQALLRARAF